MTKLPFGPLRLVTVNGQALNAEESRDFGLARTFQRAAPAWKSAVLDLIYELPGGWEGIFEDIRFIALRAGIQTPASDKTWGSLAMKAMRNRLLIRRSPVILLPMQDPRSHARLSAVLVRTPYV